MSRSTAADGLRRLAARGAIEKDAAGRWRLAGAKVSPAEEASARPYPAVAGGELTTAPIAKSDDELTLAARPRWLKPLAEYERRELHEFQMSRYG
jgi:hypothetical protein